MMKPLARSFSYLYLIITSVLCGQVSTQVFDAVSDSKWLNRQFCREIFEPDWDPIQNFQDACAYRINSGRIQFFFFDFWKHYIVYGETKPYGPFDNGALAWVKTIGGRETDRN